MPHVPIFYSGGRGGGVTLLCLFEVFAQVNPMYFFYIPYGCTTVALSLSVITNAQWVLNVWQYTRVSSAQNLLPLYSSWGCAICLSALKKILIAIIMLAFNQCQSSSLWAWLLLYIDNQLSNFYLTWVTLTNKWELVDIKVLSHSDLAFYLSATWLYIHSRKAWFTVIAITL